METESKKEKSKKMKDRKTGRKTEKMKEEKYQKDSSSQLNICFAGHLYSDNPVEPKAHFSSSWAVLFFGLILCTS